MANKGGVITRKDIIEDDALQWGAKYAKELQAAIEANNVLVNSIKELNQQAINFKKANNNKDYILAKQAEALATQQAIDAIKKQEAAELSALKIKKEAIITAEAERKAKQSATDAETKAQKVKEASVKLTIEERVQNEINNKALKQAALEKLGLVSAYDKLNKARTEAKNKLRDLIATENASTSEIKKAQKEYDILDSKVKKADKAVGDFSKNVGNYPTIGKFAGSLKELVNAFGLVAGIGAVAAALKGAYETIKIFDQSVADLKAITGATGKDLDFLKKKAIDLGKETKGGAVQVVEAYKLIASAKPELLENVKDLNKVTEATLTLSKAAGMELPEATTALTDAMNQFGAPASRAAEFVDALANGAKYGSAEIPQVTEALLKFGAVAKSSNISIQESTALIELLAENGLKGAEAGTALRNVLLKLSAPDALPKNALDVFDKMGISMEFLKDKTIPIQEKFEALKPLLTDDANLVKIFGNENIVAAKNIISHTDRLEELTGKMGEFGTAAEQAEIRSNTLQGETERLTAQYDSFILSLNEGKGVVSGFFSIFIYLAKEALKDLERLNKSWDELFEEARLKGAEQGVKNVDKAFRSYTQNGIKDQEALSLIMSQAEIQLNDFEKALNKKNKELENFNPYAINFGKSGKTLKEEKERLEVAVSQQRAIIEEAQKRIVEIKTKTGEEEIKTEEEITKLTEEELKKRLDAAKKAREKRLALERGLRNDNYELEKQRLEQKIQISNEIAALDTETDETRIAALKNAQTEEEKLLALNKKNLIDNERLTYENLKEENVGNKKNLEIIEKQHKINILKINEEYSFKLTEAATKNQEDIDKITQFDEEEYQKGLETKISKNTEAMNYELAAENKRFKDLGDLEKLSQAEREQRIQEHEQNIFNIKKRFAIEALKIQISNLETELAANDALPEKDQVSANKRQKIAEALSKAKLDLTEVENQNHQESNEKKEYSDRETAEAILQISQNLTSALGDLANALFERKISNIDQDIQKNEDYYNRQLELAGNDEAQKQLIQIESEKKREELEKKKRKEQHKQAVFNKAMSAVQVGISTAQAIMQAYAQLGPIAGSAGAILAGVMGAIQLAAVLAAPIPKYKMGRKDGPAEYAYVGDGGVHEIIEKKDGRAFMTPNRSVLTFLEAGDKVHSSVDDYQKLQRAAFMASIDAEGRRISHYQAEQMFDNAYGKEMLDELKRNTKAIEDNKGNIIVNTPKIDIPHALWKSKNTDWS